MPDLNIHKRHVLGHNLGMADESYTELAIGGEKVGQNVPVLPTRLPGLPPSAGQ